MAFSLTYVLKTCFHSGTWAFQVFMSSQSESLYWSRLLSIVAIIIACWWLPGSVVSAQLRMWLLGSSSPMSSNEGNPLTSISRWSSLAPAFTSCILRTLLGYLVTSHWPLLPIYVWIMLYTSTSIQSSSPYSLGWWQRGVGSSCKIQFLHKLGHILLFVLLCWGCYPHWSHNIDFASFMHFQVIIFHDNSVDEVHSSSWIN